MFELADPEVFNFDEYTINNYAVAIPRSIYKYENNEVNNMENNNRSNKSIIGYAKLLKDNGSYKPGTIFSIYDITYEYFESNNNGLYVILKSDDESDKEFYMEFNLCKELCEIIITSSSYNTNISNYFDSIPISFNDWAYCKYDKDDTISKKGDIFGITDAGNSYIFYDSNSGNVKFILTKNDKQSLDDFILLTNSGIKDKNIVKNIFETIAKEII